MSNIAKLPAPETMLVYASILAKPQYYIHNHVKFLMPQGEPIKAAIEALRACAKAEPVAWLYESWNGGESWGKHFSFEKPAGNSWQRNITPLFSFPSDGRAT